MFFSSLAKSVALVTSAVAIFIAAGSLYDFPKACYNRHVFGACVEAQYNSLTSYVGFFKSGSVNWEDPRILHAWR
jgi:hypothetical protein